MRVFLVLSMLAFTVSPALAYDGFSPISGPNDSIPSPVCDIINFGFCPQPAPPPPVSPDPNEVEARTALPPVAVAPHHRRIHRHTAAY